MHKPEDDTPLPLWRSPLSSSSAAQVSTGASGAGGAGAGAAGGGGACCCRLLLRIEVDRGKREVVPVIEHADREFLRLFKYPSLQGVRGRSVVSLLLGAATDAHALLCVLCPQQAKPHQRQHQHQHPAAAHGEAAALLTLYDKGRHPISCRVTSRKIDRQGPPGQPPPPPPQQQEGESPLMSTTTVVRNHHRLLLITPACFLAHCKGPLLGRFHPALAGGGAATTGHDT
jgi:hypothetical protein